MNPAPATTPTASASAATPAARGFPGFQPGDAASKSRNSVAGYVDVETDLTTRLKLATALR